MSNGCGCETGWLKWFRPPYAQAFYAACCVHDDDYDRGGTEEDRMEADLRLLGNMMLTVKRGGHCWVKRKWMALWAVAYYVAVRNCGAPYFKYDDGRTNIIEI